MMKEHIKAIFNTLNFSLSFVWREDKSYLFLKIIRIAVDVISGILMISIPRYMIDSLSEKNDQYFALLYTGLLVLTMLVNSLLCGSLDSIFATKNIHLNTELSKHLQNAVVQMPYSEFENSQTLDEFSIVKEFISEINVSNTLDTVFLLLSSLLKTLSYLYIIQTYSWLFIAVIILSIFIRIVCQNREETSIFKLQQKTAPLNRRISYVSQSIMDYSNAKEVRVFSLYDFIAERFNHYMKSMYSLEFSNVCKISPLKIILAFSETLVMFIAYCCIGYSLYEGGITVGEFVQYTGAFFALAAALSTATASIVTLKNQNNYIKSYCDFIRICHASKPSNTDKLVSDKKDFHRTFSKTIEFVNLSFRYPGAENYVLKNINLRFELGEKIAIVGQNGAGKTTLIKLLLRLYTPTDGKILLDGIDINSISQQDYYDIFSAVFQDSTLFSYSVQENIVLSEKKPMNEDRIMQIFDSLDLSERMSHQPNGLETFVTRTLDEAGSDFSGGERKKLLIARALYKQAKICIFDEPTAELSSRGELLIYDAILSSQGQRTVFLISHRLASCKRCSRILVLENGLVIGDGTHDELMNTCKLYAEMFRTQAAAYEEDQINTI